MLQFTERQLAPIERRDVQIGELRIAHFGAQLVYFFGSRELVLAVEYIKHSDLVQIIHEVTFLSNPARSNPTRCLHAVPSRVPSALGEFPQPARLSPLAMS